MPPSVFARNRGARRARADRGPGLQLAGSCRRAGAIAASRCALGQLPRSAARRRDPVPQRRHGVRRGRSARGVAGAAATASSARRAALARRAACRAACRSCPGRSSGSSTSRTTSRLRGCWLQHLRERPLPAARGRTFAVTGVLGDKDAAGIAAALGGPHRCLDRVCVAGRARRQRRGAGAAPRLADTQAQLADLGGGGLRAGRAARRARGPRGRVRLAAHRGAGAASGFGYTKAQAGASPAVARPIRSLALRDLPPVDDLVKERLTGAIILVALIVLLVPELLTGPVRHTARMPGGAQPVEGQPFHSYTINLDEDGRATRATPADSPAPSAPVAPAAEPPVAAGTRAAGGAGHQRASDARAARSVRGFSPGGTAGDPRDRDQQPRQGLDGAARQLRRARQRRATGATAVGAWLPGELISRHDRPPALSSAGRADARPRGGAADWQPDCAPQVIPARSCRGSSFRA